jgi:hypothetical protein
VIFPRVPAVTRSTIDYLTSHDDWESAERGLERDSGVGIFTESREVLDSDTWAADASNTELVLTPKFLHRGVHKATNLFQGAEDDYYIAYPYPRCERLAGSLNGRDERAKKLGIRYLYFLLWCHKNGSPTCATGSTTFGTRTAGASSSLGATPRWNCPRRSPQRAIKSEEGRQGRSVEVVFADL